MLRKLILLAIALVFALSGSALTANDTVRVEGGLISGSVVDGVRSYKGVPFAAPPVGELRWKAPQPVTAWEGVRECNDFGLDCPQAPYSTTSLYYSPPRKQNLNRQNSLLQEADYRLAEMMSNYWVNFATTGDPNGKSLPKWTPYNRATEAYLDLGDTVQLRNHLLKTQLDFIEQFQKRR